jgi:hypothetical protein
LQGWQRAGQEVVREDQRSRRREWGKVEDRRCREWCLGGFGRTEVGARWADGGFEEMRLNVQWVIIMMAYQDCSEIGGTKRSFLD